MKIDLKSFLESAIISVILVGSVVIFWLYPQMKSVEGEKSLSQMGTVVIIVFFLGFFFMALYVIYLLISGFKIPKEERMRRRDLWLKESKEYPYGRDSKTFWRNFKIWLGCYIFFFSCVLFMIILTGFYSFPLPDMIFLIFSFVSFPVGYYIWKKSKGEQAGLEITANQKKIIIASVLVVVVVNISLFSAFELGMFRKGMSMKELYGHEDQYINKTITLNGLTLEKIIPPDSNMSNLSSYEIHSGYNFIGILLSENDFSYIYYAWIPNNVSLPIPFVPSNRHLFTGILRYTKLPWAKDSANAKCYLYLEVTKVENT